MFLGVKKKAENSDLQHNILGDFLAPKVVIVALLGIFVRFLWMSFVCRALGSDFHRFSMLFGFLFGEVFWCFLDKGAFC